MKMLSQLVFVRISSIWTQPFQFLIKLLRPDFDCSKVKQKNVFTINLLQSVSTQPQTQRFSPTVSKDIIKGRMNTIALRFVPRPNSTLAHKRKQCNLKEKTSALLSNCSWKSRIQEGIMMKTQSLDDCKVRMKTRY